MTQISQMSFEEFANTVKASGAINRLPSIGAGEDVFTYSVYLNGPLAKQMSPEVQEVQFKDVMVYALTEKLQLNSKSARDNLKVAELVAMRNAWMLAVVEASKNRLETLPDKVLDDYALIANGLTHPWIQNELVKQRALSTGLQPALESASAVLGIPVKDRVPDEFSSGVVVSQSMDFTIQALTGGKVVTHENRRLETLPKIGDDVTIAYYKGDGQVFDNREKLKVSSPFIDVKSGDLAVVLVEENGHAKNVVLFNSMSSFAKFVTAQGLDPELLETAVNVRVANPKKVIEHATPKRELVSDVYVDKTSGCLAVDYKENGAVYSVLFNKPSGLEASAQQYGMNANHVAKAKSLELKQVTITRETEEKSLGALVGELAILDVRDIAGEATDGRQYMGKVITESALHIAQDMGRGVVMIHDKRDLDKLPAKGDSFTVAYNNGVGKVADLVRGQSHALAR